MLLMNPEKGNLEYMLEIREQDPDLEFFKKAVREAVKVKDNAYVEKTPVGVTLTTYDRETFAGCNLENYLKKTYHAEEGALIHALTAGYRTTDFWFMVQIFESSRVEEQEVFPACLMCTAWLWEYLHPDLIIVNATPEGDPVHTVKLKDLTSGFKGLAKIYPSPSIKKAKKLMNSHPKLRFGESPYYEKHYDGEGNPTF
jgi:cytidine deaminase